MTTLALFGSERVRRTYTPFVTKSVSHARVDNFSEIKGLDTGRNKKSHQTTFKLNRPSLTGFNHVTHVCTGSSKLLS